MRHKILILLLLTVSEAVAQGKFCNSYNDFAAEQWQNLPSVRIVGHSISHQFWLGGSDYKITSEDKTIAKMLKKETLDVEYHDTLYVNLRKLRYKSFKLGNGYTRAVRVGDNKLAFAAERSNVNVGFFVFGFVGGVIGNYSSLKNKVIYILDNNGDGKKIRVKLLDDSAYKDALLESE